MKKILVSVLSICLIFGLVSVASASVLNFDNLTTAAYAEFTSYGGFDWGSNAQVVKEGYEGWAYLESAVSGDYAFDNNRAEPVAVSISSGTFDFWGAWFTPADHLFPGNIEVEAFLGGVSQGTKTVVLASVHPLWVDFNSTTFTGIDTLVFTPQGSGNALWFAMDDFTFNVPEPGTMLLLGFGLLGIGLVRRKNS